MTWQTLHISCSAQNVESISEQLEELGALAVTWLDAANEPLLEPDPNTTPLWQSVEIQALFSNDCDLAIIQQQLMDAGLNQAIKEIHQSKLADQNWLEQCQQDFQAQQFGDHLWICPSWCEPPPQAKAVVKLDPGLAFGTGNHPTTALCLEYLSEHIQQQNLVIDYGCGSGILAISALVLGAKKAYAVDHDQQALLACSDNSIQNNINTKQLHCITPEQLPTIHADLLIANILANPLMTLAPHFAELVTPGGHLVLSGILDTQAQDIIQTYQTWFHQFEQTQRDEWVCISATRLK